MRMRKLQMESANAAPLEIKKKLIEFFEQLPAPTKETWNAKYKEECAQWVKTVASKEEIAELEELKDKKDFKTLHEKLAIYKTRLGSEERAKVELWKVRNCVKKKVMLSSCSATERGITQR
ncbi:unnamed protein product [Toxocara canis]|uniref:NPA domain-containing protein n=1 Tax=Toxocara canis TaxID=6265 RepID=A0A183U7S1_TOXCA|nr:unnamed protein product [Toxocara canis]